jgi:hypothetical protein
MLQQDIIHEAAPKRPWHAVDAALWGGTLGGLLVVLHLALDVSDFLPGAYLPLHPMSFHDQGDPFVHVLSEYIVFGMGGAVLFGLIAEIRNRLAQV